MKTRGTYCVLLWFFSRALEWQVAERKNEKRTNKSPSSNFSSKEISLCSNTRSIHLLEIPRKPLKTGRVKAAQCYKWYPQQPFTYQDIRFLRLFFYLESNPFCFYGQGSVCSLLIGKEKEEVEAEDDRETRAKQFGMSPQNPWSLPS